jgi:Zn-dependent M28 family amino/carboxypeptidase
MNRRARAFSRRHARASLALVTLLSATALAACGPGNADAPGGPDERVGLDAPEVEAALDAIRPEAVERHMAILAHDSLAGRAPGTPGFAGAARYAEETLRALGLEPAGEDGGYRQHVPLRQSFVVEGSSGMSITSADGTRALVYDTDYYLSADPLREDVAIEDASVAFVGFGVSAPALGYDDYADIDVEGKVVAWLSGAPSAFPSNERAYYSSGATKQAEAIARGAIGTLTFWAPDDPRLRWDVNAARAKQGAFSWLDEEGQPNRGATEIRGSASLNHSAVDALFAGAPTPVARAVEAAAASEPQAFDLATRVSLHTRTRQEDVASWNVVARLEGSDPDLRDEHVTYVAHVDHFGVGVTVDGDSIYNGAHDNASGTAIVLEIARAYTTLPTPPRRSILFLIVTAEEWGLLGSDYFAENPTVPRSSIVANFSLDMPFLFHPLHDIVPYGAEHSSMGESVAAAADHLGLAIGPDPIPEQVLFIRSDHFSFIRRGIPALFLKSGFETGDPGLDGGAINTRFRSDFYHTPFDAMDQDFDFGAGADHARVNFLTGYVIAQEEDRPSWNQGDFFGELFGGMR